MAAEWLISMIDTLKFIVVWFWWVFVLIWLGVCKLKWKNWPIEAIIFEKRGDNLIETNDRAGKFIDPYTKLTSYRLQKSNDTIPVPEYDHLILKVAVNTTILEKFVNLMRGNAGVLVLFRYGTKQYKPLDIKFNAVDKPKLVSVKNNAGEDVFIYTYRVLDPRDRLAPLEFEIVDWDNMNFMVQEQRASMERRKKSSEFWKQIAIPAIMIGAAAIVSIVMIKFAADWRPPSGGAVTNPNPSPNIPVISDVIPQ